MSEQPMSVDEIAFMFNAEVLSEDETAHAVERFFVHEWNERNQAANVSAYEPDKATADEITAETRRRLESNGLVTPGQTLADSLAVIAEAEQRAHADGAWTFLDATPVSPDAEIVYQDDSGKPLVFHDHRWREVKQRAHAEAPAAAAPSTWPEMAPEAYHGLAGQVTHTLQPQTEADPAGLLVTFLTSFGAMVPQPHAIADGMKHRARLFSLLVGSTSRGRKGTAHANTGLVIDAADSYFASERVFGGLASGEGLVSALTDNEAGLSDKRALVFEPEFARVLKVCSREHSSLSQVIRDAWDRDSFRVLTRNNPLKVDGAHVCLSGHITVAELRRYLSETEVAAGFANRFLYVLVRRSQRLPEGGHLSDEVITRLGREVCSVISDAARISQIRRTSAAKDLWAGIYNEIDDEVVGLFGAVTARAEAQMLRLQIIYALLDRSELIDVAHVNAAKAVWDYCEASARHIFGDAAGDPIEDRLLEGLRNAGEQGLTASQQRNLFSRHISAERLERVRSELEGRGLIETVEETTGGRPRIVSRACAESVLSAKRGRS